VRVGSTVSLKSGIFHLSSLTRAERQSLTATEKQATSCLATVEDLAKRCTCRDVAGQESQGKVSKKVVCQEKSGETPVKSVIFSILTLIY